MLAPWKKSNDKPRQYIKKQRHYWQSSVKAMVFPVVMYGCESWTIKNAEGWSIYPFELWCWRRLLRVLSTARSNQSILKEISPEYSLERLMLKLKLQHSGHLIWRANSLEKTLMLGKTTAKGEEGSRGCPLTTDSMYICLSKLRKTVKDREAWHAAVHGVTESDMTEHNNIYNMYTNIWHTELRSRQENPAVFC